MTHPIDLDQLDKAAELQARAAPGPWAAGGGHSLRGDRAVWHADHVGDGVHRIACWIWEEGTADFIAASRELPLAAVAAEIRRLRAWKSEAMTLLKEVDDIAETIPNQKLGSSKIANIGKEMRRLREALTAIGKYAKTALEDDPENGLAMIVGAIVRGRLTPQADEGES